MRIQARVENRQGAHHVTLSTEGASSTLTIPPKNGGRGSSANGGELLALALATCFCNDLYREAARTGVEVRSVSVEVDTEFGGRGEPARRIEYRVAVSSDAPEHLVRALVEETDRVAEVHNTLRGGIAVQLREITISGAASQP